MDENTTNLTTNEEERSLVPEIDMSDESIGSGKSLKVLGCAVLAGLIGFGVYKISKKIKNKKKTVDELSDMVDEEETVAGDFVEEVVSKSENKN